MRTFLASLAGATLLLTVIGVPTSASAGVTGDRSHLVTTPFFGPDFSPNGDGMKDRSRLRFTLGERADVDVTVRRDGAVLLRRALGRLDPGRHQWVWGGRQAHHRVVADGYYT